MLPSYPKIHGISPRATLDPEAEYIVEEKVDGSQFSFGVWDGELLMRSKNSRIDPDAPPALFLRAVQTVQYLHANGSLYPGWVYRAEAVCKPKHNALTYDRTPDGGLVIFDIEHADGTVFPYDIKAATARALDLEVVPVIYSGTVAGLGGDFKHLLEHTSFLGGPKIEGVVFKSVEPTYHVYGGQPMRYLVKYVREDFKEINGKNWREENPTKKDALGMVISALATEARWMKAVRHLEDDGLLENSPRDIGKLIAEVQRDVLEDDATEVGALLLRALKNELQKGVTKGLAQWYKDQLVTEALSDA